MDIEGQILKVSEELGHMPSRYDLEFRGLGSLSSQIQKRGGFLFWAKKLNILEKKRNTKWPESAIEEQLRKVCDELGKFPSAQDLKRIGRNDISSQISKKGGFEFWATKLGMKREYSDSDTGWDGEKSLMAILQEKGFSCEAASYVKCPYDLRVNSLIRIDVKSANYAEYGVCKGWFFRIGKDAQADILALYQIDTQDVYFIPWNICPKTNITISRSGGKYVEFKNRFDILEKLVKIKEDEQKIWPTI